MTETKNRWITIDDILSEVKPDFGPLREIYETKKDDMQIISDAKQTVRFEPGEKIIDEHAGDRFSVILTDQTIDLGRGQGLTYKRGLYIVDTLENKVIGGFYPQCYRAGSTEPKVMIDWSSKEFSWRYSDQDNFGIQYMEGKILEEKDDGVTVSLRTNDALKIVEYKTDRTEIKKELYDLRVEDGFRQKKENAIGAIVDFNKDKLRYLVMGLEPQMTEADVKKFDVEPDLSIIAAKKYDRRYDARVDLVKLYLAKKDKGLIYLGKIEPRTHHSSDKFYCIRGYVKNIQFEKIEELIGVKGVVESWYEPTNAPGCGGIKEVTLQDRQEFRYEIKL